MADSPEPQTTALQRFAINCIGLVGLIYGAVPILRVVLGFDAMSFTAAPYAWLQLDGAMRALPPLLVFVACLVGAWAIEHHATSRGGR
jgi:hypothetical protein